MSLQSDSQTAGPVPTRVLLVEDNAMVAMNAEELLLEIGVKEVVLASSVAEAQARCDEHEFDFALLDFDLGNEDSTSIATRLYSANVPFAFASGFGELIDVPADLGDYQILRKPYLLSDLELMIRSLGA